MSKLGQLNQQNKMINEALMRVKSAITTLQSKGFTVLKVDIEGYQPCVEIQYSPLCKKLQAVTQVRSYDGVNRKRRRVMMFEHCKIQWNEIEEAMSCG